jgi:hypothetical protein
VDLLAFHPDGKRLATNTGTGTGAAGMEVTDSVHIINFPNGQLLSKPFDGVGDRYPRSIIYTPNGRYLLAGEQTYLTKAALYIVDAEAKKIIDTLHADTAILDLAVHPQSTFFAAAAGTGVTVWKFK